MRNSALACGLLAALAASPAGNAAAATYRATLGGGGEMPPVATAASGTAIVDVDPATKRISWSVTFAGLASPVTSADITCAAAVGVRGAGIAVGLGRGSNLQSPLTGRGKLTDPQFADLNNGGCYVNIATDAHKLGELRGRLEP
jgi:hypothetical protein